MWTDTFCSESCEVPFPCDIVCVLRVADSQCAPHGGCEYGTVYACIRVVCFVGWASYLSLSYRSPCSPMSGAVLAQGHKQHGQARETRSAGDLVPLTYCVPRICKGSVVATVKKQSLGATKASPFRRTPYPGPSGPRSVPEWTAVDLRDCVPSVLAQVGHSEFDSELGSGLSSGKVTSPRRGWSTPCEELPKVGGLLTPHSVAWESSQAKGAESGVSFGSL